MTLLQRRLIVAMDEWLGVFLLVYLHSVRSEWFWPAFIFWFITVYVISYPGYWAKEKEAKTSVLDGNIFPIHTEE